MIIKKWLFFVLFWQCISPLLAQKSTDYIIVQEIAITGNKKTKEQVILRELDFGVGDTLSLLSLQERFERNSKWFVNTDLFSETQFNIGEWDTSTQQATIKITVKEAWYIYPLPLIELADRNFNIWWDDHDHSFDRINLGLAYYQNNFSGRHDKLVIIAQTGFTQKAEIEYGIPYFNKKKTIGVKAKVSFIRNRSVGYRVVDYKELFHYWEDDYALRRFRINLDWSYRPNLRLTHTFLTSYHKNHIASVVADSLNSEYFGQGHLQEKFLGLGYRLRYDLRDISLYSMSGSLSEFNIDYEGAFLGLGPQKLSTSLYLAKYISWGKRWSTELIGHVSKTLYYGNPTYYHTSSLGGSDFVRGYEYYVLNGQDFAYAKTSLRFLFFDTPIPVSKIFGKKDIPFRLFLSLNNDVGTIKEKYFPDQNPLSGKILWGKGIGLDIVFYQNRAIQIEYSSNHFGEKGLFLHLKLFN